MTEVDWRDGKLTIVIRALPSPDDCDLALRVAEAAARLAGAATIEADYFGAIEIGELRRLHTADWMHEQAVSGTRILASLIREGRGPLSMPGPNRACFIGERLLAELEAAGPPDTLSERVLATMRRVQWDVPAGFRDAGVFVSGREGDGNDPGRERETRFAIWLPDENLILPRVDYVALRVTEGEIVMVPFAAVAELAGPHGTLLDECQLPRPHHRRRRLEGDRRARAPAREVATEVTPAARVERSTADRPASGRLASFRVRTPRALVVSAT